MEQNFPTLDKMLTITLFIFVTFSMFSISVTQIAGGLGGVLWLLRTHLTGTWKEQRWPLGIPFIFFVIACLIATANAYDTSYSYKPLKKLLEILIFFWVVNCVHENRLRDSLSSVLILSAMGASLFGFYQAWTHGVSTYGGDLGLVDAGLRVEGTMSVYTTFAGLLMIVGVHAFGRVFFHQTVKRWTWVFIIIILICLLFTLTRQAWFGFLIGFMFLLLVKFKKHWPIMLGLIIAGLLLFSPVIQQLQNMDVPQEELSKPGFILHFKQRIKSMTSGEDQTFKMRLALWHAGWEIYKDHPLTGCGFRCVDLLHDQYPDPTGYVKKLRGMHNNFIQLAVDTGILGLGTWLVIWFCFFRRLYKMGFSPEAAPQGNWVVFGSAAAVFAFLAGGCFESSLYDSEVVMLLYFIMALPFAGSCNRSPFQRSSVTNHNLKG